MLLNKEYNKSYICLYKIKFYREIAALLIHIATLCSVIYFLVFALPKQPLEIDSCLAA